MLQVPNETTQLCLWSAARRSPITVGLPDALMTLIREMPSGAMLDRDIFKHFMTHTECSEVEAGRLVDKLLEKEILIHEASLKNYTFDFDAASMNDASFIHGILCKHPFAFYKAATALGYKAEYRDPQRLSVSHQGRTHLFYGQIALTRLSIEAIELAQDKFRCSTFLKRQGFPVANQIECLFREIPKQLGKLPFPWVIKPLRGRASINVVCNISNLNDLDLAMTQIQERQNLLPPTPQSDDDFYNNFLIESYIEGPTIRVLYAAPQCRPREVARHF